MRCAVNKEQALEVQVVHTKCIVRPAHKCEIICACEYLMLVGYIQVQWPTATCRTKQTLVQHHGKDMPTHSYKTHFQGMFAHEHKQTWAYL